MPTTPMSAYPDSIPTPSLVAKYQFSFNDSQLRTVEFIPLHKDAVVPGFTHRVVIDGIARDWLGYGRPSAKSATYFLRKHWELL